MILNKLYEHRNTVVIIGHCFDISYSPTKVTLGNLLCKNLEYPFLIAPIKFKDEFDSIKSPANTILIICDENDKSCLDLLYESIKNLKL